MGRLGLKLFRGTSKPRGRALWARKGLGWVWGVAREGGPLRVGDSAWTVLWQHGVKVPCVEVQCAC